MANNFCPYLGICDEDDTRGPAQDYPSFENQCFAVTLIDPLLDGLESRDQLLLADQATYCLGNGHQLCPRFRFLHAAEDRTIELAAGANGVTPFEDASDLPPYVDPALLDDLAYGYDDPAPGPRLGVWVGLASLFLVFLLCGGSLATYAGWQLVGRGLVPLSQQLGQITDLSERDPVFVLVTQTPASAAVQSPLSTPAAVASHNETPVSEPTPTFEFPKAVSPTPVVDSAQTGPVVITTPTPSDPAQDDPPQTEQIDEEAPAAPDLATAVAEPVVITTPGLATPTRRPTPDIVVPTSTPGEPQIIVVTATPTPVYPEPTVVFRSAHQALTPDGCTTLSWEVEHVQAVFLDNQPVVGKGEQRECLRTESETHTLSVLQLDGTQQDYTVTLELMLYTPTPTPTFSPTPVLTPTPTWTPVGDGTPAPTEAPPQFGVILSVDGGNQRTCQAGAPCEAVIQVTNSGNLADEIFLDLSKDSPWRVELCRIDGLCGETSISLGVGPGGQNPITLRADIPAESSGQTYTFQVVGTSGNSNRAVHSDPVVISMTVE